MKKNIKLKIISVMLTTFIFLCTALHTYAIPDSITITEQFLKTIIEIEEYANIPILMYHHLESVARTNTIVTPKTFESHIKMLADNGYTGISFEELVDYVENNGKLPEKPIIITFDDGYSSNYELAYPILKKYNMKATIFVIVESMGKGTYRDTDDPKYLIYQHFSFEEANEMIKSGLISIQSHSYDMHQRKDYEEKLNREYRHGILPLESESEEEYIINFNNDYILAKTEIETNTEAKPIAYSYPHGQYTELSERLLREMGVKATLTVKHGNNKIVKGNPETLYLLKRYTIYDMPPEKLLETIEQ